MKNGYIKVLSLVALFTLSGCISNPLTKYYTKKTDVEKQISALNQEHSVALDKKDKEISAKKDDVIGKQDGKLQGAANSLYLASEGFKFYIAPTRLDMIINNSVTEGQAALGLNPTYEAVVTANKRLTDELDEKKTSLEQLRKTHAELIGLNTKLADDTTKAKKDLSDLNATKLAEEQKFIVDSGVLQGNLKDANEALIKKQQDVVDRRAEILAQKRELMLWCGIGAALAMVGAIYSPIGKQGLITIAAVLGAATAAIPFITGTIILISVFVILALIVGYFLYNHHISDKTNKNLVHAIQDTIETTGATTATLKANLSSWNTVYGKDHSGNIITKKDTAVENLIKKTLMDTGRLPTSTDSVSTDASKKILL